MGERSKTPRPVLRLSEPLPQFVFSQSNEPPAWMLVVVVLLILLISLASIAICNGATLQQPPVPDSRFTISASPVSESRISSAFGDSFPVLKDGEILIQRHLYTAAINPIAKQPVWVAYRVHRADWDTRNKLDRHFHTPDHLKPFCLEPDDFAKSGFELGHLYGLQFVLASQHADEVNEMSIVAAQRGDLNKGPWLKAESRIKKSSESNAVSVMTGLLFRDDMPSLDNADESHTIASHCWMLFTPGPDGDEEAYLMPQTARRSDDCSVYAIVPRELRSLISDHWTCTIEGDQ